MYSELVIVANTFATGDHLTSRWSMYVSDKKNVELCRAQMYLLGFFV